MALSDATLGSLIKTEIEAEFGAPADAAQLQKFCNAVARAVVAHIQAAAVVNSNGTVTTGAGAGGSVTATGTVS